MKKIVYALFAFASISANARDVTLAWDAPSDPTLVEGTNVYSIDDPTTVVASAVMPATQATFDAGDLAPGKYCYVATHYGPNTDPNGPDATVESDPSNQACLTVSPTPENFKVLLQIIVN